MRRRLINWIPLLLLVGLALLFFYKLAFTDLILARGDTYNYFYPYWDVRRAAFLAGGLPLWTPDIFMGAPLLANPQLGTFYPLNWLVVPFTAPDAVRVSIILHIIIAAIGAYSLFRATTLESTGRGPALLAGILFALSGYAGAHVEQINQLQGLAWMPWALLLYWCLITGRRRVWYGLLLAMVLALQLFSGHTQTVFMTGFALGLMGLVTGFQVWIRHDADKPSPGGEGGAQRRVRAVQPLLLLALVVALAMLLAVPQLLPTLELTGMSNRGGGFSVQQATAFSLPPTYLGRSLLPSYDGQLFGEYVAYLGVIGLGLALWGGIAPSFVSRSHTATKKPPFSQPSVGEKGPGDEGKRAIWLVLAIIGLLFALGRFNPVYTLLADLPGFDLFRVPARWLALYTLGMSMLAGLGFESLLRGNRPSRRTLILIAGGLAVLMLLARFVLPVDPLDVVGPAIPTDGTLLLWGVGLVVLVGVFVVGASQVGQKVPLHEGEGFRVRAIIALVIIELFAAGWVLPHHDLAPREVYLGQRFTISQMLADTENATPPGRTLAISGLFFDPGDKAALETRYQRAALDEQAVRHALVAVKRQEMLYPNLPLTWGIPSVDGFGGGVLPTLYYTQFTSLLLPPGTPDTLRPIDGRLGERLALPDCRGACIPDYRWLQLTDTRYVITGKVYDLWHEDVAYDTAWSVQTTSERAATFVTPNNSPFVADRIDVLYSGPESNPPQIQFLDVSAESPVELDGLNLARYSLDEAIPLEEIGLSSGSGEITTLVAVSLVDTRAGVFVQLTPAAWQRTLSSDIKIYQPNTERLQLTDLPLRARMVHQVVPLADDWDGSEQALDLLADLAFNPITTAVIHGEVPPQDSTTAALESQVTFTSYDATEITLNVNAVEAGYLVLSDAWYPGWKANVDGEPVEVYRANVMFRGVPVPAGEHTVSLRFEPDLWTGALLVGLGVWLAALLALGWSIIWHRAGSAH